MTRYIAKGQMEGPNEWVSAEGDTKEQAVTRLCGKPYPVNRNTIIIFKFED